MLPTVEVTSGTLYGITPSIIGLSDISRKIAKILSGRVIKIPNINIIPTNIGKIEPIIAPIRNLIPINCMNPEIAKIIKTIPNIKIMDGSTSIP